MTTTDIATRGESAINVLPAAHNPSAVAQQMLVAHAEMMQTAYELASKMVLTTMVPTRFFRKEEDATAAILYGAELGLNPIQSLQRIIPIHGMPSLEARTMVALLKARGYRIRTSAQSEESVTVVGVDLEGDVYESTWTIERATKAGYVPEIDPKTGKYKTNARGNLQGNEKYITDPIAMLKAKAQSEVCREMAPDVLLGISYTSEELESERWDDSALPPAPTERGVAKPVTTDDILGAPAPATKPKRTRAKAAAPAAEPPQDAEVVDDPADNTESNNAGRNSTPNEANPDKPQVDESAEASISGEKPEPPADNPPAATAPSSDLEKSARASLTGAIFSLFGEVDLAKKENHEDRLVVIEAIVGRQVASSNELTTDELQKLRNSLHGHSEAGTLADAVNDWLNAAALKELEAEEAQASND
ncbi:hypothetical protein [Mycolicibacterium fluoranthenivorans]|uniref:RecT family protein n=1 Tax=Mycolicibacterium fluoranthenivorans TaxID=258505 RepID=A0A7X5U459_9MYCO|nr:hypothetical protein [Mycolicibacterium fluoranthenivorans]MCV7358513.1 hypothetical protein [Mycolicibacterium fluoranthenivorans]NIH98090.1 hypothetical protein [Mycolicibacterium fluoranthenivorans]